MDAGLEQTRKFADDEAIDQALRGSESGYDALYRKHRDRVYATVSRVTRNGSDTEDLVQVTFIKAFQALPRFRRQSAFSTWVTRIALNVTTTHLRKRKSQREMIENVRRHEIGAGSVKVMSRQPDEDLRQSEHRALLETGMANLPDAYREAIALHYLRGQTYLEIARELNVPLGTLKVWLFRARAKLRKEFEKSGLGTHVL